MAELAGFEYVFLSRRPFTGRMALAAEYRVLHAQTMELLRRRRPRVLWMQLPPTPLLWAALKYRRTVDPDVMLVADCHNAMFRPRWARLPFGVSLLRQCDLVIVHNGAVARKALGYGVPPHLLFELQDVPPLVPTAAPAAPAWLQARPRPWILWPGSFGPDEPVGTVIDVARAHPQWTFVVTGAQVNARKHRHDLRNLPMNLVTPGYLDIAEFDGLLQSCDLVLALTTEDDVQLSVCNEALGFRKAIVMSDTPLLRMLFGEAAVLVDSGAGASLGRGIAEALARLGELEAASSALAARRRRLWLERFAQAPAWLRPAQLGAPT